MNEYYRDIAKKMIESGATRGMVMQRLKKEGIGEEAINRAFEDAESVILLKKRSVGFVQMVAGGLIIAVAAYLMFVLQILGRPPVVMAIGGAMVGFYGLNNVLQQRVSPNKKP